MLHEGKKCKQNGEKFKCIFECDQRYYYCLQKRIMIQDQRKRDTAENNNSYVKVPVVRKSQYRDVQVILKIYVVLSLFQVIMAIKYIFILSVCI